MKIYLNKKDQAVTLAAVVAKQLRSAVRKRGSAVLAVAGGSTPAFFLKALSQMEIDWSKLVIIPTDERWVAPNHPRSNARFIRQNLAVSARITMLDFFTDNLNLEQALASLEKNIISDANKIDVAVLGMGSDGHFASFFPYAERLSDAMAQRTKQKVMPITIPGTGETRVTLTMAALRTASYWHLLITGQEKLAVLARAQLSYSKEGLPVSALLKDSRLRIHYAP